MSKIVVSKVPNLAENSSTFRLQRSKALLLISVLFLIAPKIPVISILRIEDLVFLLALPILIWRYDPKRSIIPSFMYWYLAYLGFSVISSLINVSHLGTYGLVNVIRQVQYVVWFFIGSQFAIHISEDYFRKVLSGVAVFLIIWGMGEAALIIPKIGKFTGATGRITVNTSGPYEISVVLVFLMLIVRKRVILLGLAIVLWATQSRITLAAAVLTYLIFSWRQAVVFGFPAAILLCVIMLTNQNVIMDSRILETASPQQMLGAIKSQILASPVITSLGDYQHYAYDVIWQNVDGILDISFEIRAIRWALILKSMASDPMIFLIGWGPGAWGLAVDSHVVRFLGEVGLIGTALISVFVLKSVTSKSAPTPYRYGMLTIAVCAVFIDVFTSSKIMSFLWLILGYFHARKPS